MSESISTAYIPYFFAAFGALVGIVWQNLTKKIDKLEQSICDVPTSQIQIDIADIKTDIVWIKKILQYPKI